MKKRYLVLSSLLALTLAACSQEKTETSDAKTSSEQSTVQEGTVGSKSHEASQKKAEVVDKGDHYSIQGKYDEIVVANKHYPMSKDYNPGENPTAKAELLKLIAAMQQAGFPISDHYSGFRSYETQVKLYQDYVNQDGKAEADRYSAIWLKNGTFATSEKKPRTSLQVASVWKSITALKVETMLISRKIPCKNA